MSIDLSFEAITNMKNIYRKVPCKRPLALFQH